MAQSNSSSSSSSPPASAPGSAEGRGALNRSGLDLLVLLLAALLIGGVLYWDMAIRRPVGDAIQAPNSAFSLAGFGSPVERNAFLRNPAISVMHMIALPNGRLVRVGNSGAIQISERIGRPWRATRR